MSAPVTGTDWDFRVLGTVSVLRDGVEVMLGGRRQRLVLAVLLREAGRVVPTHRLVDELWPEQTPVTVTGPLRTYVWQLRRLLSDDDPILVSRAGGYQLDISPELVDRIRFERQLSVARTGAAVDPAHALDVVAAALNLWRGPAFGDLADEPALRAEAARLDHLHVAAEELRAELLLATEDEELAVAELRRLTEIHPGRERLWAMLMTALYRTGRPGDALRSFSDARATLVDTIGVEPGVELRALELAIRRQDPALRRRPHVDSRPGTVGPGGNHNLPWWLTRFVGRRTERAAVSRMFKQSRLVTLSGSGGSGKTRLALAVAEDLLPRLPGGVWFVDLSTMDNPGSVARAVAGSLGVATTRVDELDTVCRRVGDRRTLMVLDNCEHLTGAVVEVVQQLLTRCPALHVLATSRQELGVGGEAVWRVPGLSLPRVERPEPAPFLGSEAVEFFVDRGGLALPGFAPAGDALTTVARICCRLDGLPLAIELAAALVGSLPLAEILRGLDDRFRLLGWRRRPSIPRHKTLRAALDWSFDLLDVPTQRLLAKLGVFVGKFTLDAAVAVAGDREDRLDMVRGLDDLVRTSMVDCIADADGAAHYRMLETVREYVRDRLTASADGADAYRRHAQYYSEFAAEAERHVHGPATSEWLPRVVTALPNLRAAVTWAFAHDIETALRLAGSLTWYFARMSLLDEASSWLDLGLNRERQPPAALRIKILTAAGAVAFMRGEFDRTQYFGEESIVLAREVGNLQDLATALVVRGATVVYEGDLARAEECFTEAHTLSTQLGDRWGIGWMLTLWATASRRAGQPARARRQLTEALTIFRELDDLHDQVMPLVNLALAAQDENRLADAISMAEEAAQLAAVVENRQLRHVSCCVLGRVELSLGHHSRARELLLQSIHDYPESHTRLMLAIALEGLAELAMSDGRETDAVVLLGFTRRLRKRWKITAAARRTAELNQLLDRARAALGPDATEHALTLGAGFDLATAVALAEKATIAGPPKPTGSTS